MKKKKYISPSPQVYAVHVCQLLAGSPFDETMSIGGNANQNTHVDSRDDDKHTTVWDD